LQQAAARVAQRHEVLRTTLHRPTGMKTPFQVISETAQPSWHSVDLNDVDANEQKERITRHIVLERERPYEPDRSPLHLTLVKESSNHHVLLVSIAALAADSAALANFTKELSQEYECCVKKQQEVVREPLQYVDFAEWQNELFEADDEHSRNGATHWQTLQAAGLPSPALPFEKRVNNPRPFAADSITVELPALPKIERLADEQGTSLRAVLFACWQALVWRLARETERGFVLYSLSDGRKVEDLTDAVGLYAKYLPIASHCTDEPFTVHLQRAGNGLQEADEWHDYFDPVNSTGIADSVAFEFEDRQGTYEAGPLSFSVIDHYVCLSPFKLKLSCVRSHETLSAQLEYDEQVFEGKAVKQFAEYFQRFVSSVLDNPQIDLGDVEIIDALERRRLLVDLNQTANESVRSTTLHELFEAQVAREPDAMALVCGNQQLTYEELNVRANQLAHLLRGQGVAPDVCVGLCVDRSVEMIVGMLGILKAGGAYVPLNPDHPRERLQMQLAESNSRILITSGARDHSKFFGGKTIDLDRERAALETESKHNPPLITNSENRVYVIYTSGSTGVPKGVSVRHENLINYTQFMLRRLKADRPLAFATVSTVSADLGNTCIFPALVSGGCLHVIDSDVAMETDLLGEYFLKHRIDVLKIVPSHLSALIATQADAKILPKRYLILGGEALSWDLVQRISRVEPTCQIINHYGPTETTVGSLTFTVGDHSVSRYSSTVPIGRPIANTRCYILDRRRRPVPFGVSGELYIGGAGVASGYLNQPAETADRFISDPFAADADSRMYRTGDLVRYLADDNIEFLGRVDRQVKVRGYRVELDEIEAVLSACPGVRQAVVMLKRDHAESDRIVAYLVSAEISQDELRATLKQKLPDYMVPSVFVFLKSLPLTANGKVDRHALPAPEDCDSALRRDFVAPRSAVEKELAGIWSNLLKVKAVGVNDNFFDLGGHSLLATQLLSRMRKEFEMEIPLRALFERPTVAGLAETIEKATADNTARLLAELDQISDDEAARLLGTETN
jgi:amino acid adenylation domain-containing protein